MAPMTAVTTAVWVLAVEVALIGACSLPTAGQYVTELCMVSARGVTLIDTQFALCSKPTPQQYTVEICVPGRSSMLGTNTVIAPCSIPMAQEIIVRTPCSSGNFDTLGQDTVLINVTALLITPTPMIMEVNAQGSGAITLPVALSLVGVVVVLVGVILFLWRRSRVTHNNNLLRHVKGFSQLAGGNRKNTADNQETSVTVPWAAPPVIDDTPYLASIFNLLRDNSDTCEPQNIPWYVIESWTNKFAKRLGKGGFGEVFRGVSGKGTEFETQLAVKRVEDTVAVALETGVKALHSIKREINILRSFRHRNIIKLLGYSITDKDSSGRMRRPPLYLLYELAENGDLSHKLLFDGAKLNWKMRIHIALGVARALHYLHTHDADHPAFHRDVKSSNVTLDSNWEPKVIDCGLSRYLPAMPREGELAVTMTKTSRALFGTPGYMCPYYCDGNQYSVRSEVFSYGVVLAEILTGKLQGVARDDTGNFLRMSKEIRTLPADINGGDWPCDVVDALRGIAMNCVANEYDLRTPDLGVVIEQLEDLENTWK